MAKVAIVTGGARGIGRGCALALARKGLDVALVDMLGPEMVERTAGELRAMGREARVYEADVSDHCANNGRSGRGSLAREFSGMQFDKVVHAERLLARELKQILGHTVIAALLGQLRHHAEVLDRMRRHTRLQKFLAPARERHVAIADCPPERLGEDACIVLRVGRFKAGQIVYPADVRRGVIQNNRNGARHVHSPNRRGFAETHWQRQFVGVPHSRRGKNPEVTPRRTSAKSTI